MKKLLLLFIVIVILSLMLVNVKRFVFFTEKLRTVRQFISTSSELFQQGCKKMIELQKEEDK